ncbi:MAG TPA: PIN domain-containing protein [Dehalococcoidia bacterium]|nr:PIN domain-containing protein [Dehalococcoidia bacterium]
MAPLFADTAYYVALLLVRDSLRDTALRLKNELKGRTVFTHDGVLTEVLAHVSRLGSKTRAEAVALVQNLRLDPDVVVLPMTRDVFDAGVELYGRRLDKGYSLIDCISMTICADLGVREVITHDKHFQQEGLAILL